MLSITGRAASNLLIITPAIDKDGKVLGLYAKENITIPTAYAAYQGRGMTLNPSRQDLYLINQYPDSLLKIDITGISHNDMATDSAQVSDMMTLPDDMSKVVWVGDDATGMLYVTAVNKNAIYIINPRLMEIEQILPVGQGPYEMFVENSTVYVLNFIDNSIWSLDTTDPANPVILNKYLNDQPSKDKNDEI